MSSRALNSSLSQDKFHLELRRAPEGRVDESDLGGRVSKFQVLRGRRYWIDVLAQRNVDILFFMALSFLPEFNLQRKGRSQ